MKSSQFRTFVSSVLLIPTLSLVALGCARDGGNGSDTESSTDSDPAHVNGSGAGAAAPDSAVFLTIQGSASTYSLVDPVIPVNGPDGSALGNLTLTRAEIVLDGIRLKAGDDATTQTANDGMATTGPESSVDDSLKFNGPFLVDLLANTMSPEPESITIPAGLYKKVELRVHKVADVDAEGLGIDALHPLYDNSILVEGVYTPIAGSAVNFFMTFDLSEDFELAGANGVTIDSAAVNPLVLAFRLASWFDFASLETNSDRVSIADLPAGDIALTKDSGEIGKNIRSVIKENIKRSADFGKDSDGDGVLTDDEDAEQE